MENDARSFVRRVQAEMSFIFIFHTVVQIEKTRVVFLSPWSAYRLRRPIQ